MRKDAGFEVVDRIRIYYLAGGDVDKVMALRGEAIKKAVLCEQLIHTESVVGYVKTWEIGNGKLIIGVETI
jgi:isoleucyl-tRNA synthetase